MGNIIDRQAARDKIVEDADTTMTRADERAALDPRGAGSPWPRARLRLAPILAIYRAFETKRDQAKEALAPLVAAHAVQDDHADDLLKSHYDAFWNEIGRPGTDAFLDLLYPGGASFYADATDEEQPIYMELLAELLGANVHPGFDPAKASQRAQETRAAAAQLEAKWEALRKPRARVRLYDRMLTTLGKAVHVELGKLKRAWLSEGMSEADIHAVIPDRPRAYAAAKKPDAGPSTPTS